jgi:prepilin-type processing-associated H-X9-DG protein
MKTNLRRWVGAAVVMLVCGDFAPLAAQQDQKQPQPSSEVSWVPASCTGFVHVRFAELWDGPLGRNARKILATTEPKVFEEIEKSLGVSLSQIDTITIVLPEFVNDNMNNLVVRITTTEPYDAQRLMNALSERGPDEQPANRGKVSGLVKLRGHGAVHFSGPRTLTFFSSEESAFGLLARMLSPTQEDGISVALREAGQKHQIVAGVAFNQLPRIPAEQMPAELLPLRDTRKILVVGNFDESNARLDVRLTFERNGHAAEAMRALEEGRKIALDALIKLGKELGGDAKENEALLAFLKDVDGAVKEAKLKHLDTDVQLTAQVKTDASLSAVIAHGAQMVKTGGNRIKSQNNLKQIILATINYADTYGGVLPQAAICDKNGKPLLSWRVAILPFIEQDNLYKQFHLDEPWDSEHNKKLLASMPDIYKLPGDKTKYELPSTHYLAFVGNGAALEEKRGVRWPAEITDGTSNTILVAEAEAAVPWTKPEDISYDPKMAPKLGYYFNNRCNVGFLDGSVRGLRKGLKDDILHALITRSGGEVIPNFDD